MMCHALAMLIAVKASLTAIAKLCKKLYDTKLAFVRCYWRLVTEGTHLWKTSLELHYLSMMQSIYRNEAFATESHFLGVRSHLLASYRTDCIALSTTAPSSLGFVIVAIWPDSNLIAFDPIVLANCSCAGGGQAPSCVKTM